MIYESLGNFLTVKDILKKFDPMAVRMFFLLKHYRSPIDFSEERIREAQAALDRLRNAYRKIVRVLDAAESIPDPGPTGLKENMEGDIISAMDDDFNTARAVGILFDIARKVNSADDSDVATFADAKRLFDTFGTEIFGLTFEAESAGSELVDGLVQLMIDLRAEARKDKNWEMADRIRDGLSGLGITLEDRADSTDWTVG